MATIISVSITQEQKKFLEDSNVSPSAVLQTALSQMIASSGASREYVEALQKNIARYQQILKKHNSFLDNKGLNEEFYEFDDVLA